VKLGAGGMEQIMEINLTPEEKTALQASAASVQELVDVMQKSKEEAAG
jgi:malate dehydrogenase